MTTITKENPVRKTRAEVVFGDVWGFMRKDGTMKDKRFIAFPGSSDRHFSVNRDTGELSSTPAAKGGKRIGVVGKATLKITRFKKPEDYRKDFRAQLRVGDIYIVKSDNTEYMHLGDVTDSTFLAVNTKTKDTVRGRKAEKEVVVVGYGQIVGSSVA